MDLIILQYLPQRTRRQFGVFLWLVWLHARLCSCTFLGEILNESHKDDSLMFAVHSSLWTVLSVMLTVSHFGPDVVVIVCLYLDREGLIYRVHEWCRGLHAVSTVAELWLIVLHSVLILHPHQDRGGESRCMEVTVTWWASSVSKIIPQRHNLLCVFSACTNMATVFFLSDFTVTKQIEM